MTRKDWIAAAVAFVAIAGGLLVLTAQPVNDEAVTAAITNDHAARYASGYTACPMPQQGQELRARLVQHGAVVYLRCDYVAEGGRT